MPNRDIRTGKDKHLIFRGEEVVIASVRVFGDGGGDLKRFSLQILIFEGSPRSGAASMSEPIYG